MPQPGAAAPAIDTEIACWVVERGEPAGIGTDTLPLAPSLYLPLKAPPRVRGVLIVEPTSARLLMIPEQRRLLETCAALIAIALERMHFGTVAQNVLIDMESERLRNSVAAALSHDLRTPWQTIFDKFARGQPESAIPGVGLGLAICRAIVAAHGSTIRGENGEGGRARFVFMLPTSAPPVIEREAEQNAGADT